MDFRCPSCQKDLTVPDEYAGQLMKCPLCQNTFQAPALPPPVAPTAPPPGPATSSAEAPPAPAQDRLKEAVSEKPAPPPPVPTGDYTHLSSIWISPKVVPWIAPACLLVIFVLTFFPWATIIVPKDEPTHMAWGWGFNEGNALTILYLLLFIILLLPLSVAITVLRLMPGVRLPAGLQQIWPWRSALVALLAAVTFFFLVLQLIVGFNLKAAAPGDYVTVSVWGWLVLVLHFVALVAALLDFWLEIRGPSRPVPRIDINW